MKIHYLDLDNIQYDMKTLADNIQTMSLLKIVRKQKLTLDFIKEYVLNEEYHASVEETYIDKYFVLQYQKHIKPEELAEW